MLAPEKGKSSLGIEPIRQVIETLYAHAQQGGAKVIWLPQAEQLTEAAANALLKTLEEPPEKTYFLLGCREPSRLMATLRSRCLYWHLASRMSSSACSGWADRRPALRRTASRRCAFTTVRRWPPNSCCSRSSGNSAAPCAPR